MDDLSRSREQPENSIRLLADASVSRWDKSRTPHSRAEELAQRFKNCTLTFRASEISWSGHFMTAVLMQLRAITKRYSPK
jgi:hypothetical protein